MSSQAPGDAEEPVDEPTEAERVEAWRLECFLDQGWAPERADVLVLLGVDHHRTAYLLGLGRDYDWTYDQVT